MKPSKKEALKLIPRGFYCYERLEPTKKGEFKVINPCPFWSIRDDLPEQENGYCSYLKKTDWDLNEERGELKWRNKQGKVVQITKPHEIPISLLWDRCKMCGLNEEDKHLHSKKK